MREGTAYFTTYTKGGEGDPANAIYQASITEVTRSTASASTACADDQRSPQQAKLFPGPKADGKTISLPIRVAITEGEKRCSIRSFSNSR